MFSKYAYIMSWHILWGVLEGSISNWRIKFIELDGNGQVRI